MTLTPQHRRILEWLKDGQWHCSTDIEYMRDARKRISELRQGGYDIIPETCDKRCGINHHSALKMRKLRAQAIPMGVKMPNFPLAYPNRQASLL